MLKRSHTWLHSQFLPQVWRITVLGRIEEAVWGPAAMLNSPKRWKYFITAWPPSEGSYSGCADTSPVWVYCSHLSFYRTCYKSDNKANQPLGGYSDVSVKSFYYHLCKVQLAVYMLTLKCAWDHLCILIFVCLWFFRRKQICWVSDCLWMSILISWKTSLSSWNSASRL